MSVRYGSKHYPGSGYEFFQDDRGWYWIYFEVRKENKTVDQDETSERFAAKSEAMLDAATDWSENGSPAGSNGNDDLTAKLRTQAIRNRKMEK